MLKLWGVLSPPTARVSTDAAAVPVPSLVTVAVNVMASSVVGFSGGVGETCHDEVRACAGDGEGVCGDVIGLVGLGNVAVGVGGRGVHVRLGDVECLGPGDGLRCTGCE